MIFIPGNQEVGAAVAMKTENLNASLQDTRWSVCDNDNINVRIHNHVSEQTVMVKLDNISFETNGDVTYYCMGKCHKILLDINIEFF